MDCLLSFAFFFYCTLRISFRQPKSCGFFLCGYFSTFFVDFCRKVSFFIVFNGICSVFGERLLPVFLAK